MGVIHPDDGAWVVGTGAGPFRHLQVVGVGSAGRYGVVSLIVARGAIVVERALGVFLIKDAMGVYAGRELDVVLEYDLDGIPYLGMDNRAEHAQVLPFGVRLLESGEALIGVFTVEGLVIHLADAIRTILDEDVGLVVEWLASDPILAIRLVIPVDLVGRDVVGTGLAGVGTQRHHRHPRLHAVRLAAAADDQDRHRGEHHDEKPGYTPARHSPGATQHVNHSPSCHKQMRRITGRPRHNPE
jgi:hypothetical protein